MNSHHLFPIALLMKDLNLLHAFSQYFKYLLCKHCYIEALQVPFHHSFIPRTKCTKMFAFMI